MITIDKILEKNIDTMAWLGVEPASCLFFDIETTGFSADNSQLYLIGVVFFEDGFWHARQWFADSFGSEEEVLSSFFEFVGNYQYLISFNGDGFDRPYLARKATCFEMENKIAALKSIDIFKAVKLYKKLLGLENYRQKSIETFLGLNREDKYNGGELIEVYQQYLRTGEKSLFDLLVLHNAEDIACMPDILPVLAYGRLTDTTYCGRNVPDITLEEVTCDEDNEEIIFNFLCDVPFPKPLKLSSRTVYLSLSEKSLILRMRLYSGELKHFYPDYKNYYYLPEEDMAVHKSVSGFVDKNFRQKAKASNCYTRHTGLFLPQADTILEPVFRKELKEKESYFPFTRELLAETRVIKQYAMEIIKNMIR